MKKNNKGFTLIELLAVIVILAVIALIAVPVILSLVDKSRRKAAEESAILYVDTIENMLMLNNVENTDGKTYKVKGRTVVDENDKVVLNLEIKGDVPYNGVENVIKINSGFIEEANLRFNSYYVHYEMDMETKKFKTCTSQKGFLDKCDGTGEVKPSEPETPEIGSGATIEMAEDKTYLATVYLDPTDTSKKCTEEEAEANVNEYGTPTTITSGCMKWYVYKDDGTNYTMILDHNTSGGVAWNSTSKTWTENPPMKEVKEQLDKDIENWVKSIKETARLIRADEVAEITGANREDTLKWNSSKPYLYKSITRVPNVDTHISEYFLDGKGSTYSEWQTPVATTPGSSSYAWLYDYTTDCDGCNIEDNNPYYPGNHPISGYWTSFSFIGNNPSNPFAIVVLNQGKILDRTINTTDFYGIRPVITIPKNRFVQKAPEDSKEGSLQEIVKLGDYIRYTPSKTEYKVLKEDTGYTEDQTINPSELNLWRVIRKNVDGTVELVSEYVSSMRLSFKGSQGYNNYVGTLNKIASSYETEGYTIGSRHIGYDGKITEYCSDTTPCETSDTSYKTDQNLVETSIGSMSAKEEGGTSNASYWLASRTTGTPSCSNCLYVRTYSSKLSYDPIGSFPTRVRPIVILKSTLKKTGGDGTELNPYTLGV